MIVVKTGYEGVWTLLKNISGISWEETGYFFHPCLLIISFVSFKMLSFFDYVIFEHVVKGKWKVYLLYYAYICFIPMQLLW